MRTLSKLYYMKLDNDHIYQIMVIIDPNITILSAYIYAFKKV